MMSRKAEHFVLLFSDTNVKFSSMLYQQKFLNSILAKLGDPEAAKNVISDLNKVRDIITSTKNLSLHVAADWRIMGSLNIDLNSPWQLIARKDEAPCREKYDPVQQ